MTNETPDIREFCFNSGTNLSPTVLLAIWVRANLTSEQYAEFRRMIHEINDNDPTTMASVEQMIGIIEMAKFLAD